MKIVEQYEQLGQRKLTSRTVKETIAELYIEIYNETLPVATVCGREYAENRTAFNCVQHFVLREARPQLQAIFCRKILMIMGEGCILLSWLDESGRRPSEAE